MPAPAKARKPDLSSVYDELQTICSAFAPPFTAHDKVVKGKRNFILISHQPVVIEGRKKDEMWFAGIVEQKGYIGFYYMPIYCVPKMKLETPALMKLLKGKACFHIKSLTPELKREIKQALKNGLAAYKKFGWV